MGKNIAIVCLTAVAIAGISFGWSSFRKAAGLEEDLAKARGEGEMLSVKHTAVDASLDETKRLRERVKELEAFLAEKPVTAETASAESKSEGDGNPLGKMLKGMADDPAMKEMLAGQQKMMVDQIYGPLLENLDLTEEENEELRALLVERQVSMMEQGLQLMDGSNSKEEKQALAVELGEQQEEWKGRIAELIGDENYEKMDLYEKSQQERQQIKTFKDSLSGSDHELRFDQEEALMSAMYEERKNFKFTGNAGGKGEKSADFLAGMTPEGVEKLIEENNQLQENTYNRAAEILSPEQLESFRKSQENFRTMQEFGMKMGVQMMQGNGEE